MSDEEIKKELEQHIRIANYVDLIFCNCVSVDLLQKTIDFINRQQAEIEKLQSAVQEWVDGKCLSQKHLLMIGNLQNEIEQAKSEAIKEFAERLKEKKRTFIGDEYAYEFIPSIEIDVLLAEMVGGENA